MTPENILKKNLLEFEVSQSSKGKVVSKKREKDKKEGTRQAGSRIEDATS